MTIRDRARVPAGHPSAAVSGLLPDLQALGSRAAGMKGRRVRVMEVCGTHTVSLARSGIAGLVSDFLDLRSGPGCPVCVTHQDDLDQMIDLGRRTGATVVTFGDMMRVPGSRSSLERERAKGADIRVCHSPLEALELARRSANRQVVLLAIGFETTAPTIAATLLEASSGEVHNFAVLSTLKLIPPALDALLTAGGHKLDGLILPGHVSTVIGRSAFTFVAGKYGIPSVVAGFEPFDLVAGLILLLRSICDGRAEVVNAYGHVVKEDGNPVAREIVGRCFSVEAETPWRGLGRVPSSGLAVKPDYAVHDAISKFGIPRASDQDQPGCCCGDIITARLTPPECALFGRECTPEAPVGPCMVSAEGACNAYYHFRCR